MSSDEESLVDNKCAETVASEESISPMAGSRYKHRHSQILSTIKRILCPICDCNGLCMTLALFVHSVFEGTLSRKRPQVSWSGWRTTASTCGS